YVADILSKNNYKAKVVGKFNSPDGGVDIVAERDGVGYLIQCKKFIDSDVGVKHLREFYGVAVDYKRQKNFKLIFVSTTYFTSAAVRFAKQKGIKLVDSDYLLDLVYAIEIRGNKVGYNGKDRSEAMRSVPPACPVCTRQLKWRKGP